MKHARSLSLLDDADSHFCCMRMVLARHIHYTSLLLAEVLQMLSGILAAYQSLHDMLLANLQEGQLRREGSDTGTTSSSSQEPQQHGNTGTGGSSRPSGKSPGMPVTSIVTVCSCSMQAAECCC